MSAGGGAARHDEGSEPFNGTGGTARNAAQASLFLLEPAADAAMTYFYGAAVRPGHRDPGDVPGRHGCAARAFLPRPGPDRPRPGRPGRARALPGAARPRPPQVRGPRAGPGQYLSVQTPHWPRLWRRYSVANAPRPDGTLRLLVRAIAGGLGNAALPATSSATTWPIKRFRDVGDPRKTRRSAATNPGLNRAGSRAGPAGPGVPGRRAWCS